MVSISAKRELVGRFRGEYGQADRAGKGRILDSLCQATGWNRKYAIGAVRSLPVGRRRGQRKRKRTYGVNEEAALVKVWRLSGFLASKRLAPFLGEFLDALERHGELRLPEPTRSRLANMSASTIDRLLRRHRNSHPRGPSLTKPGGLLKKQVAIRTANGWEEDKPGYCEIDTVAHCGECYEGTFHFTLSLTDICTGWSEFAVLKGRTQFEAVTQLKSIKGRLPFEVLGLDSDNGSEFINYHLAAFCSEAKIQFTRCRPYVKNDQCHIEQKNGAIVRKHAGYARYDTPEQSRLLARLYGVLRLLVNFYEPSLKGKEKAATPYRRLLASGILSKEATGELEKVYRSLNPVALRNELMAVKKELLGLDAMVSFLDEATIDFGSGF